ncbi:ATP-dependent DNA helicase Q-like SIM isoform X3 [Lotus japonicus]|uniref:ATP-dependent DNA helicase Q-like SIM isoform X3 n=1 Tax=Lotus japonicus TaxID=34305 RepID=UPI00258D745B|nr:ATP-dependent DNA helicase Q-like SIM isoform X3 [Lotus japonicus]
MDANNNNNTSSDQVIAEMVEMGFQHSTILEAIEAVGPSIRSAVEHIFKTTTISNPNPNPEPPTHTFKSRNGNALNKQSLPSSSSHPKPIDHYFKPIGKVKSKKSENEVVVNDDVMRAEELDVTSDWEQKFEKSEVVIADDVMRTDPDVASDWEHTVSKLLQKHFGFSALKSFQKEALAAWVANEDCLVLAATGSGKSLCFQIPALLTGKVVVVISPLISLMQDQCWKLTKHGLSACFLGSGQRDDTVERKAMKGVYSIIYVCPETLLRLLPQLQKLANGRGIALFAIDEVHCVSKWGHDFRPAYRELSVLRESFCTSRIKSLKFDIPLMALTATATKRVREDILESLCMSKGTKVVLTSFFRPNLRFMVKHSKTSQVSYEKDFHELIKEYGREQNIGGNKEAFISDGSDDSGSDARRSSDTDSVSSHELDDNQDKYDDSNINVMLSGNIDNLQEPLQPGPAIIYVPTRKETLRIAQYLCKFGVKAAAYNAGLNTSHLSRVHKEFHDNTLEVVVATIAFAMGIDKSNVRRIIHYGWPQSLEAYYQEAGRAGRDGKLACCTRKPSLLPSRRSDDQIKQAYILLSDIFRYGMNTSHCRAKTLVEYFGEDFSQQKCCLCDVCINGPPQRQNLKEEACVLLQTICVHNASSYSLDPSYNDDIHFGSKSRRLEKRPSLMKLVRNIRKQFQKFVTTDILWWRGLARILEVKGYIKEGDEKTHVQIKYPEVTELGMEFLKCEQAFYEYLEADMLFAKKTNKPYSSFSEWGKGWADPEIRRQRLEAMRLDRNPMQRVRKQPKRKVNTPDIKTLLTSKLSKHK